MHLIRRVRAEAAAAAASETAAAAASSAATSLLPLEREASACAAAPPQCAAPPSGDAAAPAASALPSLLLSPLLPLPPLRVLGAEALARVRYATEAVDAATGDALLRWCLCGGAGAPSWTALRSRRVAVVAPPAPLPPPLAALAAALVAAGVFPAHAPPNHALLNDYAPGEGILPHTDGPAYEPRVATLSLGSAATLLFSARGPPPTPLLEVLLAQNSLVVFDGEAYERCLHGVPPRAADAVGELAHCANAEAGGAPLPRGRRVSITLRRARAEAGTAAAAAVGAAER